jgi:Tat protein secretion system quality control protein TatD with DNase activity
MRLFDSHCHYHLGPRGILPLLQHQKAIDNINASSSSSSSSSGYDFAGAALMSTHPRDYAIVNSMSRQFNSQRIETRDNMNINENQRRMKGVACYGVHPWFLHEVLDDDDANYNKEESWLVELRQRLIDDTSAIVGEIGLDGARWRVVEMNDDEEDNGNENDKLLVATSYKRSSFSKVEDEVAGATTSTIEGEVQGGCSNNNNNNNNNENGITTNIWERKQRILSCPMSHQKLAFESQLLLATELNRPVSIHVVQAWGELLDSFITVQDIMRRRYNNDNVDEASVVEEVTEEASTITTTTATTINDLWISQKSRVNNINNKKKKAKKQQLKQPLLPPKIYFHAFSGKAGILPSLLSLCARANIPKTNVYFGFAPTIPNYYSNKTPNIMKHIGIHQLLLESDLEDCTCVMDHLIAGVEGLANALDMNIEDVANVTYHNAMRFYFDE